jgi:hypothetical protein
MPFSPSSPNFPLCANSCSGRPVTDAGLEILRRGYPTLRYLDFDRTIRLPSDIQVADDVTT